MNIEDLRHEKKNRVIADHRGKHLPSRRLFRSASTRRKCSTADRGEEGPDRVSVPDQQSKVIADFIHQNVGGTMIPLELERPYPADYNATVQQVARENETGYLPPLKTKIERMEQYDLVFLGFPTWGMQLPPPVKSFLRQYSLKGKTVIPFNTNAGYGEGSSFQTVRDLCPQSTVLEGFVTRGGVERDGQLLAIKEARAEEARKEVENWLTRITSRLRARPPSR